MIDGLLENDERILITIKSRYRRAAEYMLKCNKKSVLDIGCSVGYGSNILHSMGFLVKGIDYNKESIKVARKKYPKIEFEAADTASYKKGRYDAVVALEVIEHLKNYKSSLKNWFDMLKPGGILIISTPNSKYQKSKSHFHKKEFTYDELKLIFPGSTIEGFDWHYMTTKPITLLLGGVAALKFRMSLNKIARRFPKYSNNLFLVMEKLKY